MGNEKRDAEGWRRRAQSEPHHAVGDENGDGVADQRVVFLENLNSPFGMAC